MSTKQSLLWLSVASCVSLAGCSNGEDRDLGTVRTGGRFVVLKTEPQNNAQLFLNDSIKIDLSNPVNPDTADLTTVAIQALDQVGNPAAESVAGTFRVAASPGDSQPGRRLTFVPRFPTNNSYSNGGFRPGRTYVVSLVGGDRVNQTVLRDVNGQGLAEPITFRFTTADGAAPGQLFRDTLPGGPRKVSMAVTPNVAGQPVGLNKLGAPPVEIRLRFDQPLNPSSLNIPVNISADPLLRSASQRGRVFLEYDDSELGQNTWIPSVVELEANEPEGATLVLRPVGVLPNNALIEVVVEATLEDISGESNDSNRAYNRIFGTFSTRASYEQQFDGISEDFQSSAGIDFAAAFAEPPAEFSNGVVRASFQYEGLPTARDFEPIANLTVLSTDFTQVTPKEGEPFTVTGGVFSFRDVKINAGKVVRGQGTNPMVWLVNGTFEVAGQLSVRGADGERVSESTSTANIPKLGGNGVCGGGDGGNGSPSAVARDSQGGIGRGPRQSPGGGGVGGLLSCSAICDRGSGGGGGALATQGDPNYKVKTVPSGTANPQPIFQQQVGVGGLGCTGVAGNGNRSRLGGASGPSVFVDSREDNNFWGAGVDFRRQLRITGELDSPLGGGGGGGGGDLSFNNSCDTATSNFQSDSSGGGGGGGGGVLIVKALGPIIIRESGKLIADGGHGGGGEIGGSCNEGGGGGAGAGGMVILMSASKVEIHAHGGTYQQNNYDFAVSADGGVCVTGTFGTPVITGKYPPSGQAISPSFASTYDAAPLGGLGGMGIVQIMVPPGDNLDGTNTRLDDNIRFLRNGSPVTPAEKIALLAWRGFPNDLGDLVDDQGNATSIGDNEGDIRPSPVLLPVPFGSKTRLRSRWIDTGATVRRPLTSPDAFPRGVVSNTGDWRGPLYEFAGVNQQSGYVSFRNSTSGSGADIEYPVVMDPTAVRSVSRVDFQGAAALQVELETDQPQLGSIADRFVQYEVELRASDSDVAPRISLRIVSHTARVLVGVTDAAVLDATMVEIRRARVLAKFFGVFTDGVAGLGPTYEGVGEARVPMANVRIGFAFHTNPASPTGVRIPSSGYLYDLESLTRQEEVRLANMPFVQWDLLFDSHFSRPGTGDDPPDYGPEAPRSEVRFLRVPFRF